MTNEEVPPSFESFGLDEALLRAVKDAGFVTPSPVQEKTIPLILTGSDLIAQAQTGTGKTAAFGLPSMHLIDKEKSFALLVVTPTRELATQVSDELFRLGSRLGIKTVTICGGKSSQRQVDLLKKGAQVVVATPGRLLDLLESKRLHQFSPSIIVLDEADEMLNMGFLDDIKKIFTFMPKKRQTLLFSATMPVPIQKLAKEILHQPQTVCVTPKESTTNVDIKQCYYLVNENEKDSALLRLLQVWDEGSKAVIFCKTRNDVDELSAKLLADGLKAKGLHGEMEQRTREEVMKAFRSGRVNLLIATDVASRGINVVDVTHVINYHIPFDPESYVHRIGRTGRAGREGIAISLVTPRELRSLKFIERTVGATLEKKMVPSLGDMRKMKIAKLVQEAKGLTIKQEASMALRELEKEMEHGEIAERLLSMILNDEATLSGPEQIGATEEKRKDHEAGKRSGKKYPHKKLHRGEFHKRRQHPPRGKKTGKA